MKTTYGRALRPFTLAALVLVGCSGDPVQLESSVTTMSPFGDTPASTLETTTTMDTTADAVEACDEWDRAFVDVNDDGGFDESEDGEWRATIDAAVAASARAALLSERWNALHEALSDYRAHDYGTVIAGELEDSGLTEVFRVTRLECERARS